MTKFALFAAGKDVRNLANSGDADAIYQLGLMYESGDNMMQNMPIALNRFRQAADKGHEKAKEKLEQLSGKYNLAPYIPKSPEPEEEEE
jgi:TPR repeat protein